MKKFSLKEVVENYMRAHAVHHTDFRTGEVNMTSLAEAAADAYHECFYCDPLGDEQHWIWDVALSVASKSVKAVN